MKLYPGTRLTPRGNLTSGWNLSIVAPPVNTGLPIVTFTAGTNNLSTTNGSWTNSPGSFGYQWFNEGGIQVGATNSTYTIPADSPYRNWGCVVSGINAGGNVPAPSDTVFTGALIFSGARNTNYIVLPLGLN